MEYIIDADYMHAKRVCKDFEIKNASKYHNLSLKSDTLFLADLLDYFRKKVFQNFSIRPCKTLISYKNLVSSCKQDWIKIRIIN